MTKPLSTLACLCAALLFAACGGKQSHSYDHSSHDHSSHDYSTHSHTKPTAQAHAHAHGEGIAFTREQAKAAGLKVEKLSEMPF